MRKIILLIAISICSITKILATEYTPQTLIVKVKSAYRNHCKPSSVEVAKLKNVLAELQTNSTHKLFPTLMPAGKIDLSLVYEIQYQSSLDAIKAAEKLMATGVFEYAEPQYISEPFSSYTPNDALLSRQWHHQIIKSFEAWGIEQGDTNIVIGFTDSNFDVLHPDLKANIKRNFGEIRGNGVDDDNDGYIDNFNGYDLADNDTNLFKSGVYHGDGAASMSSCTPDNSTGMAGTGFKSLFLPIKVAPNSNSNSFIRGYEGIVYAVTHGCKVVNCSWGNTTFSYFAQDVVNFATYNYDATIVASSGNATGGNTLYYPASYDNVLSVGGTDSTDCNFYVNNHSVDIVAPALSLFGTGSTGPGTAIYSVANNAATLLNGTSFSAPLVSGAVALVRAHFPTYNALQAAEQVKENADNIYGVACNSALSDMLGAGRLNIEQALLGTNPSVVMTNYTLDGLNNNQSVAGQSSLLVVDFINYLNNATNVVATLSCASNFITITQGVANLGNMAMLQTATNGSSPYVFSVDASTPLNQKVEFKLSITADGGYSAYQYFEVEINRDYIDVAVNNLLTTVTTRGKIGYNTPYQQSGLGIAYLPYNDSSQVFVSSFMLGSASGNVSDMNYSATPPAPNFDFSPVSIIQRLNSSISALDLESTFNDNGASVSALGVTVRQRSYAWDTDPDRDFVLLEYQIRNTGSTTLSQLFAGIFADWEIEGVNNKADFDDSRNLAYAYNPNVSGLYLGIKLLNAFSANCYNIDAVTGGVGGVDISDGYSDAEKYTTLSTPRLTAGGTTGGDISQVISAGPFDIAVGDTQVVAFAIVGGQDLVELQANADEAQTKYNGILVSAPQENRVVNGLQLFPNPALDKCIVVLAKVDASNILVYDATGKILNIATKQLSKTKVEMNLSTLTKGIYAVKVGQEVKRLIVE